MEYYPFPALLSSDYNLVHEYGQAAINGEDNAVDFSSDFIPLLPLGTEAQVDWVLGNRSLLSLRGEVYLSSKNLLRIVDVDPTLLQKARATLAVNTRQPASVIITEKDPGRLTDRMQQHPAEILYLSENEIKIQLAEYVPAGSQLLLSTEVDFLTLHNQPLRVRERVLIRRKEALLLCDILPGGDDNFVAISTYAAKLAAKAGKQAP